MVAENAPHRRSILKLAVAAPLLAALATRSFAATALGGARKAAGGAYARLGVRPLINAHGTMTFLSGSLELPQVKAAMEEAAGQFVDMYELHHAAGKRLAELSGAEYGMVTAGAAAAMSLAAAAAMTGGDSDRIWQLPDTAGMKDEIVMLGGRTPFDSALRLVGGKLVLAPTVAELAAAITPRTAMVYSGFHDERVVEALKITKPRGVPLLVDASATIPPFENFTKHAKWGADLYTFSGGKGLCGPQCSGVLLGRKDLIEAAMANSAPWEGAIGRPMKVGKEEIVGVLAAIEYWATADLAALTRDWRGRVERIAKLVETVPGATTEIVVPNGSNNYPTLTVNWDEARFGLSVSQCADLLDAGEPRIVVSAGKDTSVVAALKKNQAPRVNRLRIVSMTLQPGEDLIVGNRLRQVLEGALKAMA